MDRRTFLKGIVLAILAPEMMAKVIAEPKPITSYAAHSLSQLQRYEFMEFQTAMMHAMAESMGLPYDLLTKDMGKLNFSSATRALKEQMIISQDED